MDAVATKVKPRAAARIEPYLSPTSQPLPRLVNEGTTDVTKLIQFLD